MKIFNTIQLSTASSGPFSQCPNDFSSRFLFRLAIIIKRWRDYNKSHGWLEGPAAFHVKFDVEWFRSSSRAPGDYASPSKFYREPAVLLTRPASASEIHWKFEQTVTRWTHAENSFLPSSNCTHNVWFIKTEMWVTKSARSMFDCVLICSLSALLRDFHSCRSTEQIEVRKTFFSQMSFNRRRLMFGNRSARWMVHHHGEIKILTWSPKQAVIDWMRRTSANRIKKTFSLQTQWDDGERRGKSVADNRRMMFSGGFDATTQDKTWQRWGETMMDPFRPENILCCAIVRGGGGDRRFFTMHPAGGYVRALNPSHRSLRKRFSETSIKMKIWSSGATKDYEENINGNPNAIKKWNSPVWLGFEHDLNPLSYSNIFFLSLFIDSFWNYFLLSTAWTFNPLFSLIAISSRYSSGWV